jgi:hypothetical protein
MDFFKDIINKMVAWVDEIFGFFGIYTSKYSELLVYGLLIFLASKIFKIKVNYSNK